jgi:hypothetical protein
MADGGETLVHAIRNHNRRKRRPLPPRYTTPTASCVGPGPAGGGGCRSATYCSAYARMAAKCWRYMTRTIME